MPAATAGTAMLQPIYAPTHEDSMKSLKGPNLGFLPLGRDPAQADPGAEGDGAGHDRDRRAARPT